MTSGQASTLAYSLSGAASAGFSVEAAGVLSIDAASLDYETSPSFAFAAASSTPTGSRRTRSSS